MKKKIFWSTIAVALAVLLASCTIIMSCLYGYFEGIQEKQLRNELSLAAAGVEDSGLAYLRTLEYLDYRLTWVAENGDVLFDSYIEENAMENHGSRKEIRNAFSMGEGSDTRYSSTMMEKTCYYARRLDGGTVLRISISRASMGLLLIGMLRPIIVIVLLSVVLSALLAGRVAKKITEPLNRLDLDEPLENDAYEEMAPLLERIHRQHGQITANLRELKRRKEDFAQITACMKEGLVLLDEQGMVVSINPAAQRIFQTAEDCVGKDFLAVERSNEMGQALQEGLRDGHGEIRGERNGLVYQFDFSRIESEGQTVGAVVLAFDITQQAQAEQTRREFTANVSHELKTPLQSIMGSAELMENGMVRAEDLPRFVGHIRTEANRLLKLIEDIIHLSQMDEGGQLVMEQVDLYKIAQEAADAVAPAARAKRVEMKLTGEHVSVQGVAHLLFELVYNLCDNAVKYNRNGGRVEISVCNEEAHVVLKVCDTGIGIPPEHIPRIFERFYRVDKSHSKASGGTGLGLSIVKHVAVCHHAKLDVQSKIDAGTIITVTFFREKQSNK